MAARLIDRGLGDRFEQFFVACMMTPIINPLNINFDTCRWGIPVNFEGDSGVGKSERLVHMGGLIGQPVWTIYTATKSPEHFAGVFVPTPTGEVEVVCGLPQVKQALIARGGIIFLDEISCAPGAVQAALLSFVNERQVGEYVLPNRTRIVLAMNPGDIAANGQELEIPFANRMAHFPYKEPSEKQWGEYMQGRYRPPAITIEAGEAAVRQNWHRFYPKVASTAAEFMGSNKGQYDVKTGEKDKDGKAKVVQKRKIHNRPDPDDPRAGGAWASHRTWSWAMYGVTTIRCLGLDPKLEIDMVECLVGEGLATEFASYMAKADIPNPEEALSGKWEIPRRLDIVRATVNACAGFVIGVQDTHEKLQWAVKCWELLNNVVKAGHGDIILDALGDLIHDNLATECTERAVRDAADVVCNAINYSGHLDHIH